MSYRSFKHLLGETSLERKCRFIFGLGIFLLVTVSFTLYGLKTEQLVKNQTTQTARMFVNPTLKDIHYKKLGNENFGSIIDVLWGDLSMLDEAPNAKAFVLKPDNPKSSSSPKKPKGTGASSRTSSGIRWPGSSSRRPTRKPSTRRGSRATSRTPSPTARRCGPSRSRRERTPSTNTSRRSRSSRAA